MARHIFNELEENEVSTSYLRVTEQQVKRGVPIDMGGCDEWPSIRNQILDADLSATENHGRPIIYGKVAATAGIEDGVHKIIAEMMQA